MEDDNGKRERQGEVGVNQGQKRRWSIAGGGGGGLVGISGVAAEQGRGQLKYK